MTARHELMGLPVDALSMSETVSACAALLDGDGCHQHVVLNAAKVVAASTDARLAQIIRECTIVNADGQSIVWAGRLLGVHLPERVAGVDLMDNLMRLAATRGDRVFLLGARDEVVHVVATRAKEQGVDVAGWRHGYWTDSDAAMVAEEVRRSGADLLFLAIPSPQKEEFLAEHLASLGVRLAVGVGGSFDIAAGVTKRAPALMQKMGLEWAFRLAQEPRRMFKRYLYGNTRFLILLVRELMKNPRKVARPGWFV